VRRPGCPPRRRGNSRVLNATVATVFEEEEEVEVGRGGRLEEEGGGGRNEEGGGGRRKGLFKANAVNEEEK